MATCPKEDSSHNLVLTRDCSSHIGSLLLTGYWKSPHLQPVRIREKILRNWATSRLEQLKLMCKSMSVIGQKANATSNPWFKTITKYSDVPRNWTAQEGYPFKFIQLEAGNSVHEITTEVVIVGSGPGGGVSAKNLAEAGHKVLVVDKGYYFKPESLPVKQSDAGLLFDNSGIYLSDDSGMSVVAGSTWGGGGSINWSVCLKLQKYVREEWAAGGLPLFTSSEYDESQDRVWEGIGASSDAIRHNHNNRIILDGAKKLGWHSKPVDQNTSSKEHYCGQCHLGCGMNEKKGPAVAWLPKAADAGAECMEGLQVDKILFAADGVTAIGVEGAWTSRDADGHVNHDKTKVTTRKVRIKASKVIVSSGCLQTPALLMKSGVKNPQVGKNLHMHPANLMAAVVKDDERPWEGGIITSVSCEFENLDNKGHGVKLEPLCLVPYVALSGSNWDSGVDARMVTPRYRHQRSLISITRDRDTGHVYLDKKTGKPRIAYTASAFDCEHALDGMEALAKLLYVEGASEIRPLLMGVPPFIVEVDGDPKLQAAHPDGKDPEFTDPKFAKWLKKMRKVGNKPPVASFNSAHQMGSCRMSAKAADGVVDPKGKVWGHKNLYLADASVFPSASGVNPMVTVMSIADYISRGISAELLAGAKSEKK
ncbi:hypothetical protein VHEMI05101 [[Torrubiella] hemipterigena]|uniref:Long-chain-alcohol oxidase n=1 Tax=[Torrubiella] hemipterigena TaxID=1531966 RepID=A0A0A1THY0_9HYPO|nr:hypothetical protein VHEMI05101 [[Torrubiella] hemipterigena]